MNTNSKTIEQILISWGRAQQSLPQNHEVLKDRLLASLNIATTAAKPEARAMAGPLWLSLTFAGLAIIAFIILSPGNERLVTPQSSLNQTLQVDSSTTDSAPPTAGSPLAGSINESMPQSSYKMAPEIYPLPTPEVPSADTREFLKTDYSASLKTRHVSELTERLQTTVRGFGGRIDSSNSSEKFGYVNFVVPASRFDAFRNEVKTFVGAKFLTEQISSQNLLPEKRSIEDQQIKIQKLLSELNSNRDQLTATHNKAVSLLQGQINAINKQLETVQDENQRQALFNQNRSLKARLADENSRYTQALNSFDAQIKNARDRLDGVNQQNGDLLDSVATVRGAISLSWISAWDVIELYIPINYLVALGLVIAAISTYFFRRKSRLILS